MKISPIKALYLFGVILFTIKSLVIVEYIDTHCFLKILMREPGLGFGLNYATIRLAK